MSRSYKMVNKMSEKNETDNNTKSEIKKLLERVKQKRMLFEGASERDAYNFKSDAGFPEKRRGNFL